jgi:hypothetical protein
MSDAKSTLNILREITFLCNLNVFVPVPTKGHINARYGKCEGKNSFNKKVDPDEESSFETKPMILYLFYLIP